ncbi:DNA topoisomerase 2-associated protein pat1 [Microbotryomycetes sp. JL221]|nr:DNA topoisomerase 2-associated protein pat1 [Microbotryomycetes sp. JL221]
MSGGYGFDEDVAVYSFDSLQDNGLAGLLDEGLDAFNDETFGDAGVGANNHESSSIGDALCEDTCARAMRSGPPSALRSSMNVANHVSSRHGDRDAGKDFDFAGSTARALGKDLQPTDSSWLTTAQPVSSTNKHSTIASRQSSSSPWSALDSDPLLSAGSTAKAPLSSTFAQRGAPASIGRAANFKTLEEIEADLKATARQNTGQAQSQPQAQMHRPLTLAEIEADMLNRSRAVPATAQGVVQPQDVAQSPSSMPQTAQVPAFLAQTPHLPTLGMPPPAATSQQQPSQHQQASGTDVGALFPPLPSQATVAALEQQLHYLTMNQHAQHPSLTNAQLQALLRQAQSQATRGVAFEGNETQSEAGNDSQFKQASEQLIRNVEQRIREHEDLERRRKLKAAKIASMAKYNNLMSNSDKDFITRIQVSQLVTEDPYADDFYFHIMAAIRMSRQPLQSIGNGPRRANRRDNAMNRMAQNVQRLVDLAKQRNKNSNSGIEGTLGKIAARTRSTPRQLLQVKPGPPTANASSAGTALLAGLVAQSADLSQGRGSPDNLPLSHRAACSIVEKIYDIVLELEQLRRLQPQLAATHAALNAQAPLSGASQEALDKAQQAIEAWTRDYQEAVARLWSSLRVMDPLDICSPHPFISLLAVSKGKKIMSRAMRHLSPEQNLTIFTLIVATFDTLDTVRDAPLLDAFNDATSATGLEAKQQRAAVAQKTDVFLTSMVAPLMSVIGQSPLRMVTGMLGLMMERNNIVLVLQSKPGLAFLTVLLSRAESLKQAQPTPDEQDLHQWTNTFDHLFASLNAALQSIFPSARLMSRLPFGSTPYLSSQAVDTIRPEIDLDDEPVWQFLAAVAVCADANQQQTLVTNLREKVLENVASAKRGKVLPEVAALKIRNVNLLLHSLGLDASQLTTFSAWVRQLGPVVVPLTAGLPNMANPSEAARMREIKVHAYEHTLQAGYVKPTTLDLAYYFSTISSTKFLPPESRYT